MRIHRLGAVATVTVLGLLSGGSVGLAGDTAPAPTAAVSAPAPAGGSELLVDQEVDSEVLGREVTYSVYLPRGYDEATTTYPVVYLLHGGAGGQSTDWAQQGDIQRILDRGIARRDLPPMVVVMPDARRDPDRPAEGQQETYYMNDLDGEVRYEDMFVQDLVPAVESTYRVSGAAQDRGLMGLSMGGYGSLMLSMLHPGEFVGAAGLSVAHRTDEQVVEMDMEGWNRRHGRAFGEDLLGEQRLTDRYRYYNLLDIVDRTSAETLAGTGYYLDVGSYDDFFRGNADLHEALTDKGVPHRFMAREGAHDWDYWQSGAPGALEFLGDLFGAPAASFADVTALVDRAERDGDLSSAGAWRLRDLVQRATSAVDVGDEPRSARLLEQLVERALRASGDPAAGEAIAAEAELLVDELSASQRGSVSAVG